jgi:D-amino peptidase
VQGIEAGVDAALFIGYHARVGTTDAILDHTWSSTRVNGVWLNDEVVGEIGLTAAVCGHSGAPVVLISGDEAACAEATALLGPIETAVVRHATGRTSAECLPPEVTAPLIEQAAARAVRRVASGQALAPSQVATPVTVTVAFIRSKMVDAGAIRLVRTGWPANRWRTRRRTCPKHITRNARSWVGERLMPMTLANRIFR